LPMQQCTSAANCGAVDQAFVLAVGFAVPIPAYLEYYCGDDMPCILLHNSFGMESTLRQCGWQHLGAAHMSIINGAVNHAPGPCGRVYCVGLMGEIITAVTCMWPTGLKTQSRGGGRQHTMAGPYLLVNATPSRGFNGSSR
jgi:hypothetical protein